MLNRELTLGKIGEISSKILKEMEIEKNLIEELKKIYLNFEIDIKSKIKKQEEILFFEKIKYKDSPYSYEIKEEILENKWIFKESNRPKILAIDTSEMAEHHINPYFVLINVGYFFYDYAKNEYYEESIPSIYTKNEIEEILEEGEISWLLHYLRLIKELEVIREINKKIGLENVFVFLDESFSSGFLSGLSDKLLEKIMNKLKENLDEMIRYKAVPLAVFYSRSRSFVNSLGKEFEKIKVSNSEFFNEILNNGQRSPVFKLINKPTSILGNKILAFYLKVSEGNVLRVEFHEDLYDKIEEIHRIVLMQSIIGNGYPYCMERAHEQAIITEKDRDFVLNMLNQALPKGYFVRASKKLEKKISGLI